MDKLKLYTEHSAWFIPVCILVGLLYAFVLYQKKGPWGEPYNKILFGIRFVLVSFLCFLLVGPLLKYIKNYIEKPTIVLAVDNSQSIKLGEDSTKLNGLKQSLSKLAKDLEDEDIKVNVQLLNKTIPSKDISTISFDNYTTNLSGMLNEVETNFENRNLSGIVMVSDGVYNQGTSPTYNQYSFPVFTVGLGDTIPKKDFNLKSVLYNKISYQGNKFPIVAEIHNHGFSNQQLNISLKQGGKTLQTKSIQSGSDNRVIQVEFLQSSENKGLQHYVVEVEPVKGEFTYKNNLTHVYIDIIEGKENILIVALTPHPDIKAIKSALETKETYHVETFIPGLTEYKDDKYDLVIFHQIPDAAGTAKSLLDKYLKRETSVLFIVGNQTHLGILNNINNIVKINTRRGQFDNVTPSFNPVFEKFKILPEEQNIINNYPPVTVPFGDFLLKENSDIVLSQKIGKVVSNKPLLLLNNSDNKKTGILLGEGIWDWRLTEFNINNNTQVFDKFISNLVQFLSTKEDKRKFRVYPTQTEFYITDRIYLEAEVYNDVFEKIYGQKIDIKLSSEDGKTYQYSFTNSEKNPRIEIKGLKPGLYKYTASTTISGKQEKSEGEFTVQDLLMEAVNTTADFGLLRSLSQNTQGKFYQSSDLLKLAEDLKNNNAKSILHSNEEFVELINIPWLFFIILFLISGEWFIRRYRGGY